MMAEEEKKRVEQGLSVMNEVGACAFVMLGMNIQMDQYVLCPLSVISYLFLTSYRQTLKSEVSGRRKQTLLQTTSLVERRTAILKRIRRFREIQRLHMPGFDAKSYTDSRPSHNPSKTDNAEDICLWLPSELNISNRRKYCPGGLSEVEDRLRYAEATDTLESLRHHLRTRSFTNRFKIANITGQIQNTRARGQQATIDDKVHMAELQYRRARRAVLDLRGHGEWERTLQVLNRLDVRALNERELTQQEKDDIRRVRVRGGGDVSSDDEAESAVVTSATVEEGYTVGEGHRRPSWIWFSGHTQENMQDPLTRTGESLIHFIFIPFLTPPTCSPSCRMGESTCTR